MPGHIDTRTQLIPECVYHIFNRGVENRRIFFSTRNYSFFLQRMVKYLGTYLEFYSYSLLPNHFHLMVKVKSQQDVLRSLIKDYKRAPKGMVELLSRERFQEVLTTENLLNLDDAKKTAVCSWVVSNQFRLLFLSFSKAINAQEKRHGALMQKPFRRKLVNNENYFRWLVWYIHRNPLHHGLTHDFKSYRWSSYKELVNETDSFLNVNEVVSWFGNRKKLENFHTAAKNEFNEKPPNC